MVVERILAVSREQPLWGCGRICSKLKQMGTAVSSPTIQKVLIAGNLGTKQERLRRLEETAPEPGETSVEMLRGYLDSTTDDGGESL